MLTESFNIDESDIDLLMAEEYLCNRNFRRWLLLRLNCEFPVQEAPIYVGRSISNQHGESDLLIVERSDKFMKHAIMVENKISAPPTVAQAERYLRRGRLGVSEGHWDAFVTVLVAPKKYLSNSSMKFDYRVAYEELIEALEQPNDERSLFKCELLRRAIKKTKKPWQANPVPELTEWFVEARKFAVNEFPDLPLPEEGKGRSPSSKWITFYLSEFPASLVAIEIKPHNGHIDLRLPGVDLGELRRAFVGRLPTGADAVIAKSAKSCAIRLIRPKADLSQPFATQSLLFRDIAFDADRLLRFARDERNKIMELLGYAASVPQPVVNT